MPDLIAIGSGSLKIYKSLKSIMAWAKDVRINTLLKTIESELSSTHGISQESFDKLFKESHSKNFREKINTSVTNALLAESTLGVRINAILISTSLNNDSPLSYDLIRLIRATKSLTDYEIIFAKKIYEAYKAGQFPKDEQISEEDREKEFNATLIRPNDQFKTLLGADNFIPKIQYLKECGILADNPHGFVGVGGGWGYGRVSDNTKFFYDATIKAEQYNDDDNEDYATWKETKDCDK